MPRIAVSEPMLSACSGLQPGQVARERLQALAGAAGRATIVTAASDRGGADIAKAPSMAVVATR